MNCKSKFSLWMRTVFAVICFFDFVLVAPVHAQNISLVGKNKPTQANSGFGDVWGEGNIACLGNWTAYSTFGFGIYDISNPSSPVLLNVYNYSTTSRNRFEQGVISNKICYVGCWGGSGNGSGLHILSLTNPAAPVLLSRITKSSAGTVTNGFDDVHTLFLDRNFLYEAAHNAGIVSVKVFDVSNPAAPVFVRDIVTTNTTKVHQMTIGLKGTNTILYTSGWGGNDNGSLNSFGQTDLWDVSDVGTKPAKWLGRIYSGYNSHSSWPTPDGNTLVVCREIPGGEVRFYDITTPPNPTANSITNPVPITVISPASMGIENDIPHNPVIVGNLLFLSWYQNGLQIFDISDRTKPVRIGSYDTFPGASTSSYQGNWGIFPKLGLNKLLVSDINSGFYILDASAVLTNTNNYPPLLVTQPTNTIVDFGSATALSSAVTGSALKFQWRFNNAILPGATNSALIFDNLKSADSGNYFLVASNSLGSVTSAVVSLSVTVPEDSEPLITGEPQSVSVYAQNTATFSVAATGAPTLQFQWRFNGDEIFGATNNTLVFENVTAENVGNYSVVVSNDFGAVTSSNAFLSILDSPYLSNVRATAGLRNALISWNSSEFSDGVVQFGVAESGSGFSSGSYVDRMMTTNHTILLTGLSPATRYTFQTISSTETNSFFSAVYQFTTAGAPIVVDESSSGVSYTGAWTLGSSATNFFGDAYRFANSTTGGATATATFRPNMPFAGKYDVQIWYSEGSNRSTNAPYLISYSGGTTNVFVNQRINGGQWVTLASGIPFAAGTSGSVQLGNNASASVVIADAVQFIYRADQDSPTDNTVPAWWQNFYFPDGANPLADPDGDGYTTAQEYILGTSPIDANSKLQLDVQAAGSAANINFWPFVGDRSYQLLYRSNLTDTAWQIVSPGSINSTQFGHGIFTLSTADAANGFYRLAVGIATNGTFSGSRPLRKGETISEILEPSCGVNRIYVR